MQSVVHSSRIALQNPEDYEARSNIMWTETWALNTLIAKGKFTDWMVHMLGQSAGAYMDATHGMTLSAVSFPYCRYIMPYGLAATAWNTSAPRCGTPTASISGRSGSTTPSSKGKAGAPRPICTSSGSRSCSWRRSASSS